MPNLASATFLFITSREAPEPGRIERRMLSAMEELIKRGATVYCIAGPGSHVTDLARKLGAKTATYRLDRWNFLRTTSRLRKYMKRHEPSIVHTMGFEASSIARWAATGLPIHLVASFQSSAPPLATPDGVLDRLRIWQESKTIDRADAIVVDTEYTAARLHAVGIRSERLFIDPTSVRAGRLARSAEAPLPEGMPPAGHGTVVGYAGRLETSRGLATLLAAAAALHARRPEVLVAIAGQGPESERLRASAHASHVRFFDDVAEIPAVLNRLDVAIFPSPVPGTPTTLVEAAALGRPIVASDVPGISELYEDGVDIVLVPPGDDAALAAAVLGLLEDPARAAAIGEAARLRTIDEYSTTASLRRLLDLYRKLIA